MKCITFYNIKWYIASIFFFFFATVKYIFFLSSFEVFETYLFILPCKNIAFLWRGCGCHLLHKTLYPNTFYSGLNPLLLVFQMKRMLPRPHIHLWHFFTLLEKWALILAALLLWMFPQFLHVTTVFPSTESL